MERWNIFLLPQAYVEGLQWDPSEFDVCPKGLMLCHALDIRKVKDYCHFFVLRKEWKDIAANGSSCMKMEMKKKVFPLMYSFSPQVDWDKKYVSF